MVARRASRSKKTTITLDLSDVETRGRFHEDGDYLLKVVEMTREDGDKFPYLSWQFAAVEGDSEGAIVYNNTSLSPQSLWNLRTLLEALGVEIPDSEFDLDPADVVDLEVMGSVEMEPYEGKKRPRLVDFWAAEEKAAPKKKRGKKADADEPEEKPKRGAKDKAKDPDPEITEDEINDMSEDELDDLIEENDLDVDLDEFKTLRKQRAAVIDAATASGIIGEAEPEPEEKTTRRSRRGAAKEEPEEEAPTRRRRSRR